MKEVERCLTMLAHLCRLWEEGVEGAASVMGTDCEYPQVGTKPGGGA